MLNEFHQTYGHFISEKPTTDIPENVTTLRKRLIDEEVNDELMVGLESKDLLEIADGAADAVYVIIGTCVSYGIPFDRVFLEVHHSNMTKEPVLAVNGEKYGTKTPKGPNYIAPDIIGILTNPDKLTKLEELYGTV